MCACSTPSAAPQLQGPSATHTHSARAWLMFMFMLTPMQGLLGRLLGRLAGWFCCCCCCWRVSAACLPAGAVPAACAAVCAAACVAAGTGSGEGAGEISSAARAATISAGEGTAGAGSCWMHRGLLGEVRECARAPAPLRGYRKQTEHTQWGRQKYCEIGVL
jgi:hypothetical protein